MRESRCIGLAWALAVSMVMICATMKAADAEKRGKQNVSERGGSVSEGPAKNRDAKPGKNADVVDEGNADQSVANRVDNPGKVTVIQSMVLEPPSEKDSFLSFDSGKFAYIEWTEGWVDESISPNDAREVGLELTSTLPGNAGQFPLQAHGNLQVARKGGSGSGKKAEPEFHWAVKTPTAKLRIYLFLWGYQGEQKSFTPQQRQKIDPIITKLRNLGYEVYEDGNSYTQGKIDKAFEKNEMEKHPKKVIIDWNTTAADWLKYMQSNAVAGVLWTGHGWMEPWPGCPDDRLLALESRVWTATDQKPEQDEKRLFVREWQSALSPQCQKLAFIVMHACCTGGLGEENKVTPWKNTMDATKTRVIAKYGSLPAFDRLSFVTFDELRGYTSYLKTYDGNSWPEFDDVPIATIRDAITE